MNKLYKRFLTLFTIFFVYMGTLWASGAKDDYLNSYLTIESLSDNDNITLQIPAEITLAEMTSVSYSTDGTNWTTVQINSTEQTISVVLNQGEKVFFKGLGNQCCLADGTKYLNFSSTDNYFVYGNIMSLLYGDDFASHPEFPEGSNSNFDGLFAQNYHLVSAENLILPATTMTNYCYWIMFRQCESLTVAPALPATILADGCYGKMFLGCSSLTAAPNLPATTMAYYCYGNMFEGCTFAEAPALPATTLALNCYSRWRRQRLPSSCCKFA